MNRYIIVFKNVHTGLLAALIGLFYVNIACAQTVTVTASGTITSSSGLDSSVVIGGIFTETLSYNINAPVLTSGAGYTEYVDSNATGTVSFGDYTLSASDAYVTVDLNRNGTTTGYVFASDATGPGFSSGSDYGFTLYSSNSTLLPSTALSSVAQYALSNFDIVKGGYVSGLSEGISGNVASYTVSATPEPACWMLLLAGLFLLAIVQYRRAGKA